MTSRRDILFACLALLGGFVLLGTIVNMLFNASAASLASSYAVV